MVIAAAIREAETEYVVYFLLEAYLATANRRAALTQLPASITTLPPLRVLAALREENRWHHYGSGTLDHPAKRRLLAVFCPPSEWWREQVLRRGREVAAQACGLAFGPPAADA